MVTGGNGKSMPFWNTITFKKEHSVKCCCCDSLNGLIELPNHCIAVSGGSSSTIDIIDTKKYKRIRQIGCPGYIVSNGFIFSFLHLLNNGTFIYFCDGCFCQISSTTYDVLFKDKTEKEIGKFAIISSSNGRYIIADNYNRGVSIFRVKYI